jgi:hypothetical protein
MCWAIAGVVCVLNCRSSEHGDHASLRPREADPDRTCLNERCDGIALEVSGWGAHSGEDVAETAQRAGGFTCRYVRLRGTVRCVAAGNECGWQTAAEAEAARDSIERALSSVRPEADIDDGAKPIVHLDECACRTYVEATCPP